MSAKNYENLSNDTIRAALSFINNEERDIWVRMAMAVKTELGEDGFEIWDNWSRTGSSYNEKAAKQVWKSAKIGRGVSIGTLIFEALAAGFRFDNDNQQTITDEQAADRKREREIRIKQAEAEERQRQKEAAEAAAAIWDSAEDIEGNGHKYLKRKGVAAHGLRVGGWPLRNRDGEIYATAAGTLLIPIRDKAGNLSSLQGIFERTPNGYETDKAYLKDGKKSGGFHVIGKPEVGGVIAITEGYATGATIHEQTGWCVFVCFDRTNLEPVAKHVRTGWDGRIVICADNDQFTKGNPGVTNANAAGKAAGAMVYVPQFADLTDEPTDFNDLFNREGADVVRRQLGFSALAVPVPDNDNREVEPINVAGVDHFTPLPDVNGKGAPLSTIRNLHEILRRLSVRVRYNIISKRVDVLIPGASYTIDNEENAALAVMSSWCERFGMSTGKLQDYILAIADTNLYNPVAQWVTSKPWDGVSRLQDFFDTVRAVHDIRTASGASLKEVLIRRWMLSALAGAFQPLGVSAHGVLTFVGGQNLGKTSWFKSLAPAHLNVIQDGLLLNPSDKDSVSQCVANWLVELGELDATFRKADIAQLKSFITKERDTLRRPYARADSKFGRRTLFFASVNETNFLHDTTGNRRFWTIECAQINFKHGLDMQQVWAELYEIYQQGERDYIAGNPKQWTLTPEELDALNDTNRDYEAVNPVHDLIDKEYDWDAPRAAWSHPMSATEIITTHSNDKPNKADANTAASYVVKQYGVEIRKVGKNRDKRWMMPPKMRHRGHTDEPPL